MLFCSGLDHQPAALLRAVQELSRHGSDGRPSVSRVQIGRVPAHVDLVVQRAPDRAIAAERRLLMLLGELQRKSLLIREGALPVLTAVIAIPRRVDKAPLIAGGDLLQRTPGGWELTSS